MCSLAKCNAEWVRKVPSRVPLCVLNPNCGVRFSRRGVPRIAVSTMTEKSLASVMERCIYGSVAVRFVCWFVGFRYGGE